MLFVPICLTEEEHQTIKELQFSRSIVLRQQITAAPLYRLGFEGMFQSQK